MEVRSRDCLHRWIRVSATSREKRERMDSRREFIRAALAASSSEGAVWGGAGEEEREGWVEEVVERMVEDRSREEAIVETRGLGMGSEEEESPVAPV